ncbi:hypothetical protein EON67_01055 [archaeon]|nr:MAG: hypothetical protein EON67_01055 [archaeon]
MHTLHSLLIACAPCVCATQHATVCACACLTPSCSYVAEHAYYLKYVHSPTTTACCARVVQASHPHMRVHAYLLVRVCLPASWCRYQNKRAAYIGAWWNVVNWDYVNELYAKVSK